jgi:hypothetical protein
VYRHPDEETEPGTVAIVAVGISWQIAEGNNSERLLDAVGVAVSDELEIFISVLEHGGERLVVTELLVAELVFVEEMEGEYDALSDVSEVDDTFNAAVVVPIVSVDPLHVSVVERVLDSARAFDAGTSKMLP